MFVIVPTFKEAQCVESLLACFAKVKYPNYELLLVNGNPGDATSLLVSKQDLGGKVRELKGRPELFWSGLQNIGLRYVRDQRRDGDLIFLMNVDVLFETDIISDGAARAQKHPGCQIGGLGHSGGIAISSGVKVRSWWLALNKHPYAGWPVSQIPGGLMISVHFLPGRCMLFPAAALEQAGLISERWLPHYAADYEFSNRLRLSGCAAYLHTDIKVEANLGNTGNAIYRNNSGILSRLSRLFSIKSPYNPIYRFNYVCLTYPWLAIPTAMVSYMGRTLLEILVGGAKLKRAFSATDRGFSG